MQELVDKLEIIEKKKWELYETSRSLDRNHYAYIPTINLDDIKEALTYCIYHFKGGGLFENIADECSCKCLCQACEMIPTSDISKLMQEIGEDITEENVIFELINKGYANTISNEEFNGKS